MTFFVYLFISFLCWITLCAICIFLCTEPENQSDQLEDWTEQDTPTDPRPLEEDMRLVQGYGSCVAAIIRNENPLEFEHVINTHL